MERSHHNAPESARAEHKRTRKRNAEANYFAEVSSSLVTQRAYGMMTTAATPNTANMLITQTGKYSRASGKYSEQLESSTRQLYLPTVLIEIHWSYKDA